MVSKPERLIEDLFDSLKYELRIQIPMMGLISQWEKFCSYQPDNCYVNINDVSERVTMKNFNIISKDMKDKSVLTLNIM